MSTAYVKTLLSSNQLQINIENKCREHSFETGRPSLFIKLWIFWPPKLKKSSYVVSKVVEKQEKARGAPSSLAKFVRTTMFSQSSNCLQNNCPFTLALHVENKYIVNITFRPSSWFQVTVSSICLHYFVTWTECWAWIGGGRCLGRCCSADSAWLIWSNCL